jgi:16S rRNA (guanine527-N7)-methyltransferase
MDSARITELLEPFLAPSALSERQLQAVHKHLELLLKWNAKINLTAVRGAEQIVARHFGESFFAACELFPEAGSTDQNSTAPDQTQMLDIGSGAGFPAIPIKLLAPCVQLTLIESNRRKATFLREVIRALQLERTQVLSERAEAISQKADLVTFRAVEHFEQILPIASRLLKPRGRLGILIGEGQVQAAERLLAQMSWQPPISIPASRSRVLLIGTAPA